MSRHFIFTIDEKNTGRTVKDFLRSNNFSHGVVSVLKKNETGIMVNGQRVFTDYVLKTDDCLELNIIERSNNEAIPLTSIPLNIVYEDEDILVVNKPAGMPIHPSRLNYTKTLGNGIAAYLSSKGLEPVYHCINRLDKDTSGLTIIAKNIHVTGLLSEMVKRREISREYTAIVEGKFDEIDGTVDAPILKIGTNMKRIVDPSGETAITHYHVLAENNGHSLVRLKLETGRTHQIRVHMKHIGHPLIGDTLYNPENTIMDRQALHATSLHFIHPLTDEEIDLRSELPDDMQRIIKDYGLKETQ